MSKIYDYIIVGSGLFGSTCAYELNKKGYKVLVLEKKTHIGGNIYTTSINGIDVHQYGAHIFHTDKKYLWDYIGQFCQMNAFINSPIAVYRDEVYNLPFNMNTFHALWGVKTPDQAKEKLREETKAYQNITPKNLEEKAKQLVGKTLYEKLIKGYTEKQWGRGADTLPAFIINRIPLRFTYNNNYFNDPYQGIPNEGYTAIITRMLEGIEVRTNADFFDQKTYYESISSKIIYTGMIDAFFHYQYGALDYRSLRFEHSHLSIDDYQGNAVVNYTEGILPYTRIIEHKHFNHKNQSGTIITKEYPLDYELGKDAYYPINDDKNNQLYQAYDALAKMEAQYIFGGRLASYKYYDMDDVIEKALETVKDL